LSERFSLPEARDAWEKGRWTVALLERAVRRLSGKMGVEVQLAGMRLAACMYGGSTRRGLRWRTLRRGSLDKEARGANREGSKTAP
jgi:hypothetical protein